jgi:hypothetical protein
MLERSVRGANLACMTLETAGYVEPQTVREALAKALAAHPVLTAGVKVSPFSGRPYWKVGAAPDALAASSAERAFTYQDLRNDPGWQERLAELCRQRYFSRWDIEVGPQVGLEQYALPEDRTCFVMRWPHFLMDAEGAQWFLSEIARHYRAAPPPVDGEPEKLRPSPTETTDLPPDDHQTDVLDGRSLFERLRLLRTGLRFPKEHRGLLIRSIVPPSGAPLESVGLLHRHWPAEQTKAIQERARASTPSGPALYARYLAACVVRALDRVYQESSIDSDAFLITFPMRAIPGDRLERRPVPGNYLVSPLLCARRELIHEGQSLDLDFLRQLDEYRRQDGHLAQWAMIWAASFMRTSFYEWVFRLPFGFESLSSGFSYYGEIRPPLTVFCGLKMLNFYGGFPLGTPPGWNPAFSRFQDRLNLSLTWNRPDIPDPLAERYAELIEAEVLGSRCRVETRGPNLRSPCEMPW